MSIIHTPDELYRAVEDAKNSVRAIAEIEKIFAKINEKCYEAAQKGETSYTENLIGAFTTIPTEYGVKKVAELMTEWGFKCSIVSSYSIWVDWGNDDDEW